MTLATRSSCLLARCDALIDRAETAKAFAPPTSNFSSELLSRTTTLRRCASTPACACSPAPSPACLRCLSRTHTRAFNCWSQVSEHSFTRWSAGACRRNDAPHPLQLARPHAINTTTTTTTLAKLASSSHPPPSSRPPAPPPPIDNQVPSVVVHRPSTSIADRPTAAAPSISSSSSNSNSHSAGSSALRGLLNRFSGSQQNREEQPAADTTTVVHDVSVSLPGLLRSLVSLSRFATVIWSARRALAPGLGR